MTSRSDFVSFLSDYGRSDEFVGVCHAVMLDIAPQLRDRRHHPRRRRRSTCGPVRSRSRERCSTCPRVSCSRSSIPASEPSAGASPSKCHTACSSVPTTACSRRPSRCSAARSAIVVLENDGVPAARAGPDVRRSRHHGARRRPHRQRRPARRPRRRDRRRVARARESCRCRASTTAWSTARCLWVDRFGNCQLNVAPEQLAASSARTGCRPRGADGRDRAPRALGPHVRRRQPVGARADRRLLRQLRARLRPAVGGRAAQAPRRQHRHARAARRGAARSP